ncbi:hypothetical protein Lesp01_81520 [Lentzea sp. NBRC 102530]|nr:hypothetical protein Lesp01_81520 [Lentzea sp. NBRC 102530]
MISADPVPPPRLWWADEPRSLFTGEPGLPPRAERRLAKRYRRADDMPPRQFIERFTPSASAVVIPSVRGGAAGERDGSTLAIARTHHRGLVPAPQPVA